MHSTGQTIEFVFFTTGSTRPGLEMKTVRISRPPRLALTLQFNTKAKIMLFKNMFLSCSHKKVFLNLLCWCNWLPYSCLQCQAPPDTGAGCCYPLEDIMGGRVRSAFLDCSHLYYYPLLVQWYSSLAREWYVQKSEFSRV